MDELNESEDSLTSIDSNSDKSDENEIKFGSDEDD